jgi:hypothetical protein
MEPLEIVLCATALVIGLTGTWSPCGFSMIETIGPTGHTGGLRTTIAACATFLPGAIAGGVVTFGLLAGLGGLALAGGELAYVLAGGAALAAAALEARGVPIVPQIRRQLPEHWRRTMPMPVAAALYGVLLGLGFTTFVLTFGVWALAGIALAVGDLQLGVLLGFAFGVGRALPIIGLAPLAGTGPGAGVTELMAERPGLYRGARLGDALALTVAAAMLFGAADATAERVEQRAAADPSANKRSLAFQRGDGAAALRRRGEITGLPGRHPAIGGSYVAVAVGDTIRLLHRISLEQVASLPATGANAIALSDHWLAWRTSEGRGQRIRARRIDNLDSPPDSKGVYSVRGKALSGPSVHGSRVVFAVAGQHKNAIRIESLKSGNDRNVLASREYALTTPSLNGNALLFVRIGDKRQRLVMKRLGTSRSRSVYSRRKGNGILWSTSLTRKRAYATLITGSKTRIISVSR